jgi:transcriptional regulator with XRE-family HTH domain
MKDRLLQLLEKEKISSAEFADRIGVQRSNVSHILNGRNNPGFSFIQKVLETFPGVNPRWLINGEGSFSDSAPITSKNSERNLFSTSENIFKQPVPAIKTELITTANEPVEPPENKQIVQKNERQSVKKNVVRVMFFYDDNTFDDFSPTDKL